LIALIVDDDMYNRELLSRMVARLGWLADTAENGSQAIAACKAARYDVVLLDLNMPDMNGQVVAEAIRGISDPIDPTVGAVAIRPVRIIVVTGADISRLANVPLFDGALPKPFVFAELKKILDKMMA